MTFLASRRICRIPALRYNLVTGRSFAVILANTSVPNSPTSHRDGTPAFERPSVFPFAVGARKRADNTPD